MIWLCRNCGHQWYRPIQVCIFCGQEVVKEPSGQRRVKGITEVRIPSIGNEEVPYFVLLLEDKHGNLFFEKSWQRHELGELFEAGITTTELPTVAVIGTGITGQGIAQICAQAGCKVILKSRALSSAEQALCEIGKSLLKAMTPEAKDAVISKIAPSTEISDLKLADIIVESVAEDLDIKKKLFTEIGKVCSSKAILASNTSSLSISELAKSVDVPERVVGLHFFNPIVKMRLVEIVKTENTAVDVVDHAREFIQHLNKIPIVVKDSPGFIVNRLLIKYLNEAVIALETGAAETALDIDTAVQLGLNHPIGPFRLIDLIGLDVFLAITKNLHKATNDQNYAPTNLVKELVSQGKLGRKTGEGFYEYR